MASVCANVYSVGDFYCGAVFGRRGKLATVCTVTADENNTGVRGVLFRRIYKYKDMD